MNMLRFLLVLFFGLQLQAQNEVQIWKNGVRGAKTSTTYSEEIQYRDGKINGVNRVTDPSLTIFLPEERKANGASVVILPGGGYGHLAIDKEGYKIAEWFNQQGVAAFVLKYRLPSDEIMHDKSIGPLQDAQRAIRYVRENAAKWKLDRSKVGIMGFSAGGHLAATLSTHYEDKVYEAQNGVSAKPDFSVLIYPVISMNTEITHAGSRENLLGNAPGTDLVRRFSNEEQVTIATPKTFLVHSADDEVVPVENSLNYFTALNKNEVPVEMHIYETGGHGYGMGWEPTTNAWPGSLKLWLQKHGIIK